MDVAKYTVTRLIMEGKNITAVTLLQCIAVTDTTQFIKISKMQQMQHSENSEKRQYVIYAIDLVIVIVPRETLLLT